MWCPARSFQDQSARWIEFPESSQKRKHLLFEQKMPVDAAATPVKNKAVLNSNHDDSQHGYVWKAFWQTGVLTPNPVPSQALQRLSPQWSAVPASCYGGVRSDGAVFREIHFKRGCKGSSAPCCGLYGPVSWRFLYGLFANQNSNCRAPSGQCEWRHPHLF